jgi:nucleoside 2-deoxyribosyltransferase
MAPGLNAQLNWMGVCWATSWFEVDYLITLLEQNRYVFRDSAALTIPCYVITPKGYEQLEELRDSHTDSRVGFCAMWFSKDLDQLWSDGIELAIVAAGYLAKRIDGVHHNNRIDDEIIATIRRSKFVVADFTGHRGGVYFEAGFALGLGRPVIWCVQEDELDKLHFDTRQYNFITWQADRLAEFRSRLANRIEATIGHGPA